MNEIAVALIGLAGSVVVALLSLAGVVYTGKQNRTDMAHRLEINQAVTDTKIEELTREVREHNGFARRMPAVEEQIKEINHRISDLEEAKK